MLPITFLHLALWLDRRLAEPRPSRALGATLGLVCLLATAFPWLLVREAGVSPTLAVASGAISLALTARAAHRYRRRDPPAAFNGLILQWILFLGLVVRVGVPALDRQNWAPLQAPYLRALELSRQGASLACAGLNETQLGFSSLTFHQVIQVLGSPEQLQAALDQPRPVAVLVEPGWWARAQAAGVAGIVVPTEADTLPARRRDRAPVLVINARP